MLRLIAFSGLLALGACADPIDESAMVDPVEEPAAPVADDLAPGGAEASGETGMADGEGIVPTLAEVQVALAQCAKERDVLDAECEADEDGARFTCTYSLDGETPETKREAIIAAKGDTYVLIDIPEDCDPQ